MEYCCHVWAGAPNCYLELLDKLQKWISSLLKCSQFKSLFYRYYFGRCSSELAELVPLPYSRGRSACYSDRLYDFSATIPKCYENLKSTVSFLVQLDSGILCL